jgi:hypothetical protein
MRAPMPPETVSINLEPDEALVLYDLVARYTDSDRLETVDQADVGLCHRVIGE